MKRFISLHWDDICMSYAVPSITFNHVGFCFVFFFFFLFFLFKLYPSHKACQREMTTKIFRWTSTRWFQIKLQFTPIKCTSNKAQPEQFNCRKERNHVIKAIDLVYRRFVILLKRTKLFLKLSVPFCSVSDVIEVSENYMD